MNFPRNSAHLHSVKFAPFALISLFLFTNLTGIFFSHALAPVVNASPVVAALEVIPLDIPTSGNPDLDWIIFRTGERQGVDPRFIHAVIWQESKYDANAHSGAGAHGLMQLMPATARRFGCKNVSDPTANVEAGTKYLSWLLKRFDGNVAVDRYQGVPPYSETQNYVRKISVRYGKTFHPVLTPEEAKHEFHLVPEENQVESIAGE